MKWTIIIIDCTNHGKLALAEEQNCKNSKVLMEYLFLNAYERFAFTPCLQAQVCKDYLSDEFPTNYSYICIYVCSVLLLFVTLEHIQKAHTLNMAALGVQGSTSGQLAVLHHMACQTDPPKGCTVGTQLSIQTPQPHF